MNGEMKAGGTDEIEFQLRDIAIFKLPDPHTRLSALQYSFFPRMDRLVLSTVDLVRRIYDTPVLDEMSMVHRPNHRKDAEEVRDYGEVFVGLGPTRAAAGETLETINRSGKAYVFGPGYLVFNIDAGGCLSASGRLFIWADDKFRARAADLIDAAWDDLGPVLERFRINDVNNEGWTTLRQAIRDDEFLRLEGPMWHFPLSESYWLFRLQIEFAALYPLLEATSRLARRKPIRLAEQARRFREWMDAYDAAENDGNDSGDQNEQSETLAAGADEVLAEMGTYRTVADRRWWQVLHRDDYTCKMCGRSPKDGVMLEVDHIRPRSKGGADVIENLQTLCRKCNNGKSNLDDTDLR